MSRYPFHFQSTVIVAAPLSAVFGCMDDPLMLAGHMSEPSWRTGWGSMQITLDERGGRAVGSHVRLSGKVFGIPLKLEEVVIEHVPPRRKVWETVGGPSLLVIGAYQMGFELTPLGQHTRVCVFIDYGLPHGRLSRLLARVLGRYYAAWCTHRMVEDTRRQVADAAHAAIA